LFLISELPNAAESAFSSNSGGGIAYGRVGRHLATRNEMRVSGSDSYALLFLLPPVQRSVASGIVFSRVCL